MRTLLQLLGWNLAFAAAFGLLVFGLGPRAADSLALWLPGILGAWLLVLGGRFGSRRPAVIALAAIAGLLFLCQAALFGMLILLSEYNRADKAVFEFSLLASALLGAYLLWWFLRVKLKRGAAGPERSGGA